MIPILVALHVAGVAGLALYGLLGFVTLHLFLRHRHPLAAPPAAPTDWPAVTVQLPVYNEREVVERLIDAAAALDYPPDRLQIQLLDDSTDDTTARAVACIARHSARGLDIALYHRPDRQGFKAGALAAALALPLTIAAGSAFPEHEHIIFLTFCVIVATLVVQGLGLVPLIRLLGIPMDSTPEQERIHARQVALQAALARLDELASDDGVAETSLARLRSHYEDKLHQVMAQRDGAAERRVGVLIVEHGAGVADASSLARRLKNDAGLSSRRNSGDEASSWSRAGLTFSSTRATRSVSLSSVLIRF